MAAPRPRTPSELRYSDRRLRSAQYGLNHKTVAKWRKRAFVNDVPMGPKAPRSTVLSPGEEAIVVAFRKHTPPLFMDKRPSMTDADQMRDRAARLSALAGQAREHRAPGYARELEQIAAGILAHAQAIDRREGNNRPPQFGSL